MMDSGKRRVLHVLSALHTGGVERMLLNYYSHMDREKVHFDFIVHRAEIGMLESSFINMGSEIYHIAALRENLFRNLLEFKKIISLHQYDCIHFHMGYNAYFVIRISKLVQPKAIIIVHSHIAYEPLNIIMRITKSSLAYLTNRSATNWCACSYDAGVYQFGLDNMMNGKVNIIYNAIELEDFCFKENVRTQLRKQYELDNRLVLGNIGRLTNQKNQTFLIQVLRKIVNIHSDIVLVLVGAGEDDAMLKDLIKLLELEEHVLMLGARKDVNLLYNMFDLFVLPSRYEGLGITLIEAQANGLHCIASEMIPREVNITNSVEFIPLEEIAWIKKINECLADQIKRTDASLLLKSRYNIISEANRLEEFYCSPNKAISY